MKYKIILRKNNEKTDTHLLSMFFANYVIKTKFYVCIVLQKLVHAKNR